MKTGYQNQFRKRGYETWTPSLKAGIASGTGTGLGKRYLKWPQNITSTPAA